MGIVSLREEITMSVFDSLKEEAKKRKQENQDSADFIDRERERIRLKREEAREKRNIIRKKIKFVDDIVSKSEAKKDADELARIEEEQSEKIKRARAERRNRAIYRNKGKLAVSGVVCLAIIFGGWFTADKVQEHKELEKYNAAVEYILDENYEQAEEILQEVNWDDSSQLLAYAKVQQGIDSYSGEPDQFQTKLDRVDGIDNAEVRKQVLEAKEQVEEAEDIQNNIDRIVLSEMTLESKDKVDEISEQVSKVDERYEPLLDTEKLESAETAISHLEKEDAVGKMILAINEIGEVTLESEETIDKVRSSFNELKTTEKTEVVNVSVLRSAETTLSDLKREKEEKEREAKEQAKREADKKAKEQDEAEANREKEMDRQNSIVWITPTGHCYHTSDCSYLRGSDMTITYGQAKANGLDPCSRCNPDRWL